MDKENPPNSPLKQIRTFQGDVADALKVQNESVVSIQRKEQARRSLEPEIEKDISDERKKIIFLVLGIIVLTSMGVLGGWYAYTEFINKTAPPLLEAPPNRLISAAVEVDLDATGASRESLLNSLDEEWMRGGVPNGEVKHVILRTGTTTPRDILTTERFLNILKTRAPSALARAMSPIFMLGSVEWETSSVFILVKLSSFENAFAGMLGWEGTILSDLGPLLGVGGESLGGTSWRDIVVKNKDARAIVDEAGEVLLLYSFFDNEILIITNHTETLDILVNRLSREKLIR